ncbi:radical SAM protein [Streptomyces cellostaticus]|uniref:radical SAM protein n=1 Tax=Streptomyces cellostaticus TaxID=67285 RepID=UPI0020272F95|nr:radical SAM protein [Streptomyces cellostaticus]
MEEYNGRRYQNCNVLHFDGTEYLFSHRAILTLVTTASCNAACKFCSNEITFTPNGPFLEMNPDLGRVIDFAELAGVRKVAFTGGEPTANPAKLARLVSAVAPRFHRARLHTNGFGLAKTVETPHGHRELLPVLIASGLTGASLSIAHHETTTNRHIMRIKGRWGGMSEDDVRWVASHASDRFTPRLSCVLSSEGVHKLKDILEYIEWGVSLGIKKFIFRSCSQIPEPFQKGTAYSDYNEAEYIPIEPLVREFGMLDGVQETYTQHKSDSHVHVFQLGDDVTVDIDESSEEEDPDSKIRRINVMPDGVAYTSWIDPRSHLFADDATRVSDTIRRELPLLSAL